MLFAFLAEDRYNVVIRDRPYCQPSKPQGLFTTPSRSGLELCLRKSRSERILFYFHSFSGWFFPNKDKQSDFHIVPPLCLVKGVSHSYPFASYVAAETKPTGRGSGLLVIKNTFLEELGLAIWQRTFDKKSCKMLLLSILDKYSVKMIDLFAYHGFSATVYVFIRFSKGPRAP
ncbi:hypothetical protein GRJ2_002444700 [Grus japonensis]|uniref:Uncharacterized protein n=1 Tax=Grus japonensis TaxID=30415 RepID=A0ABC9XPY5_GRUJA